MAVHPYASCQALALSVIGITNKTIVTQGKLTLAQIPHSQILTQLSYTLEDEETRTLVTASTLSVFWATWNHVDPGSTNPLQQRHRPSASPRRSLRQLTQILYRKRELSLPNNSRLKQTQSTYDIYNVNTADCNKMQSGRCYLGRLWF